MTHTDEDLLALANSAVDDLLYDAQNDCQFPDYMRIADWLQGPSTLADMRGWIVEATLRAIVAERQAIRDNALDDAAQAASNRAAYWWDEATAADDTGRKKLSLIYEAKALACTELAAAIRVMKGKPE